MVSSANGLYLFKLSLVKEYDIINMKETKLNHYWNGQTMKYKHNNFHQSLSNWKKAMWRNNTDTSKLYIVLLYFLIETKVGKNYTYKLRQDVILSIHQEFM